MTQLKSHAPGQRGFTLIETMIAIAILTIGIVSLLAVFGTAVAATQNAQENLIARQKALETMESIYTARNTQQIFFSQIFANDRRNLTDHSGSYRILSRNSFKECFR